MSKTVDEIRQTVETAREIANVQWRVEEGGRYSVASQNITGIIRGTIMTLADGWERSQMEIYRLKKELAECDAEYEELVEEG